MNDPNRIVERIEKLLNMARSAIEEAETIIAGAIADREPLRVRKAAEKLINDFYEELG